MSMGQKYWRQFASGPMLLVHWHPMLDPYKNVGMGIQCHKHAAMHPLTSFCAHQGTGFWSYISHGRRHGCRFDSDGGGYLDRDELARVFRTSHGPEKLPSPFKKGLWRLSYRIPLSMVNGWLSTIPRKSMMFSNPFGSSTYRIFPSFAGRFRSGWTRILPSKTLTSYAKTWTEATVATSRRGVESTPVQSLSPTASFGQVAMERSPTKNSCIGWRRATIWLRHCTAMSCGWKMSTKNKSNGYCTTAMNTGCWKMFVDAVHCSALQGSHTSDLEAHYNAPNFHGRSAFPITAI